MVYRPLAHVEYRSVTVVTCLDRSGLVTREWRDVCATGVRPAGWNRLRREGQMMALRGPERAIDGLRRPWGIWVMGDGTAAVSVGFSGVYVHVSLDSTLSDLAEAHRLLVVLGHPKTERGFADRNGVITFPAL